MEEDPEPPTDVAERRDKFKQRSVKALSSSSTEGQLDLDNTSSSTCSTTVTITAPEELQNTQFIATKDSEDNGLSIGAGRKRALNSPIKDGHTALTMRVPQLKRNAKSMEEQQKKQNSLSRDEDEEMPVCNENTPTKQQNPVTNYNRVMSNHRNVTKPKDVKYKRINKAKSKSLEELRGRLKNLVEKVDPALAPHAAASHYTQNVIPQTAQSYA